MCGGGDDRAYADLAQAFYEEPAAADGTIDKVSGEGGVKISVISVGAKKAKGWSGSHKIKITLNPVAATRTATPPA